MTIALDAFSQSAAGFGDPVQWTHTPAGTPNGIIVIAVVPNDPDTLTACTYGGVSMTEVSGSPAVLATGEGGRVAAWFLGSSIPTGAQTVSISHTGSASVMGGCFSTTGIGNSQLVDSDASINSASQADPSCTLQLNNRECFCCIGFYSGQNDPASTTPLSNWTSQGEHDIGSETRGWYSYDIVGQSDVTAGWTQTAEDALAIAVAVSEVLRPPVLALAPTRTGYM